MLKFLTAPFNLFFRGINKFFESIFGKPATEIPKDDSRIDLDIYTASGKDYDPAKIEALDREKIDLAYNNGVSLLQEIDNGMKVINARTTLLLGYLATIVAALIAALIQDVFMVRQDMEAFIWVVLVAYLGLIFIIAYLLISPRFAGSIYNEPKNIINKNMFPYDIKLIKIFEIRLLQSRIEFNYKRQNKLSAYLKNSILATFMIPVATFLFYVLKGFVLGLI